MDDLPEAVLADLRAARIPLAAGMRAWPSERESGAPGTVVEMIDDAIPALWWPDTRRVELLPPAPGCGTPDPRDRATFLLLCDETERRGLDPIGFGLDVCSLPTARRLVEWMSPGNRASVIRALCRALAQTGASHG